MVIKSWGHAISGPILAFAAIVLAILAAVFAQDTGAAIAIARITAWILGSLAVVMIFVAQFDAWREVSEKLQEALHPEESENSLRKRTLALADQIELFIRGRIASRNQIISFGQNDNAEFLRLTRSHDQGTLDQYAVLFRDRLTAVVHELKSKGVYRGLQYDLDTLPRWMDEKELEMLRAMARSVDHNDNAVHF